MTGQHQRALQRVGNDFRGPGGLVFGGSYGEGASWDNPWLWFAAALGAALGISCATDNWPCEGSGYDDNGYRVPGE